jgi:hypothetical protein
MQIVLHQLPLPIIPDLTAVILDVPERERRLVSSAIDHCVDVIEVAIVVEYNSS